MTDAHDTRHAGTLASGTGEHQHHRGVLREGSASVGYWRCALSGWGPCPDEPDPRVRLAEKVLRHGSIERPTEPPRCPQHHDPARFRWYTSRNRTTRRCLDCQAEWDRVRRIARRIERQALSVA